MKFIWLVEIIISVLSSLAQYDFCFTRLINHFVSIYSADFTCFILFFY